MKRVKYKADDIESLRDFSKGETYQYNVKVLLNLELIERSEQQELTTDNGKILGWRLSDLGKQILLEFPEK